MDSPEHLSRDIDYRRERISETVDEIGNRIMPGRIVERNRHRAGERVRGWRESVMGMGEPIADVRDRMEDRGSNLAERAGQGVGEAGEMVREAPEMLRRRTAGAPLAAGAVAYGFGFMFGALLPGTRREEQAVQRVQPQLKEAMTDLRETGREVAEELREPARGVADDLTQTAKDAASHAKEEAVAGAQRTTGNEQPRTF